MNARTTIVRADVVGINSPSDDLGYMISLTHLLLIAAETCRSDDGRAMRLGVCQVLDRLKPPATAMGSRR